MDVCPIKPSLFMWPVSRGQKWSTGFIIWILTPCSVIWEVVKVIGLGCPPLGSLLNKLLKKIQLSKFEDFIGFIQWLLNQAISQWVSRMEFWGVVQMEGFYRKKGGARKPSAKYIWGRHLFLGGEDYKDFIMQRYICPFCGPGTGMQKE